MLLNTKCLCDFRGGIGLVFSSRKSNFNRGGRRGRGEQRGDVTAGTAMNSLNFVVDCFVEVIGQSECEGFHRQERIGLVFRHRNFNRGGRRGRGGKHDVVCSPCAPCAPCGSIVVGTPKNTRSQVIAHTRSTMRSMRNPDCSTASSANAPKNARTFSNRAVNAA